MEFSEFRLAAVVSDLERASEATAADAVEFRMDHADGPLEQLAHYEGPLPIIATNRREAEGGAASGGERLATLAEAAEHRWVEAIDVELATIEAGTADDVMDVCEGSETALVVSWHDFEGTPAETKLERRLRAASAKGTVGKAALTAQERADVLRVLSVTDRLSRQGLTVATMCMGEAGRHSRIIAPLYGSRIGYAPIHTAEATAPGQYDLETMASLIDSVS